jgi:hypothetical protein
VIRRGLRLVALLALLSALAVSAASAATAPTLGVKQKFGGQGFGTVEPTRVDYGGDGTSFVEHVHWRSWGGAKAVGTGRAVWVWPGFCSACGSEELPATVVAYDLGSCRGHQVYTHVAWYFPSRGEHFSRYLSGNNLCTGHFSEPPRSLIEPRACAGLFPVGAVDYVTGLQATHISCRDAAAFLKVSRATRYAGHNARYVVDGWYCGSELASETVRNAQPFTCQKGDFTSVSFDLST